MFFLLIFIQYKHKRNINFNIKNTYFRFYFNINPNKDLFYNKQDYFVKFYCH